MLTLLIIVGLVALLSVALALKKGGGDFQKLETRFDSLERIHERTDKAIADGVSQLRNEIVENARAQRIELQQALKLSSDSLVQSIAHISEAQQSRLIDFANQLNSLKQSTDTAASQLRQEVASELGGTKKLLEERLSENATRAQQAADSLNRRLSEFSQSAQENDGKARTELSTSLRDFRESLQKQISDTALLQKQQLDSFAQTIQRLTESNETKADSLRQSIESKLSQLQTDNAAKLEEMRRTVDEKLQGTLEKRLGESFKLVSDRLEQVHKGLGEMQNLATGVGDLKRVLTNVKTRGTWSEVQLGNLLEQILAPEQFSRNVATKRGSQNIVEFAIKLPGREDEINKAVWLPIDAKFPKDDYERLVDASERGDAAGVEQAAKDLETRIRSQARDIRDKYIAPPGTTDFGLLYLPTEGLYAEVVRRPGLVDSLQREFRVVVVGPMTIAALLNSLQMGFRTLAIQKRSSEVWKVLGAVKTEFERFGDALEKVKKKLDETGSSIEEASKRTKQIEKKLKDVEKLPAADAVALITDGLIESDAESSGGA